MSRIAEIEAEFSEPLRDVIVGMREQGCTWRTIAGALGVSRAQVYLWRRQFGIKDRRRFYRKRARVDSTAQTLGYRDAQEAIRELRWSGLTLSEVANLLGCSVRTVTRHYPPGLAGEIFVKTEKYLESRRRTGRMAVERRRRRKAENPTAKWRSL